MKRHIVVWTYGDDWSTQRVNCFEQQADAKSFKEAMNKIPGRKAEYFFIFDPVKDVRDFHTKFQLNYDGKPRALGDALLNFRLKFLREELTEYETHASAANFEADAAIDQAALTHNLSESLDALVDLMYVLVGTSHLQGFDKVFYEAWARVHEANMRKVLKTNPSNANEKFKLKISKPKNWESPELDDLVEDNTGADQ